MATKQESKPVDNPDELDAGSRKRLAEQAVERAVRKLVKTPRPVKVQILPVGPGRYRVNVWDYTGKNTEDQFIREQYIAESFYHVCP